MSIRCTSKAIIIEDGRILLNRCFHADGNVYYDLPGGGQHPFESMEEAVRREVKEETGYDVKVLRLAAVSEEIRTDASLRERYPDYCHRILHIFLTEIVGENPADPTEKDLGMDRCVWIPIEEVASLPEINPSFLKTQLSAILASSAPLYFGTDYRAHA